jgi:hypothetical protein
MDRSPRLTGSCFISSRSVSRVLYPGCPTWGHFGSSIIYLVDLPPGIRRAALNSRYTWSFSPGGGRQPVSPPEPVSSYLTFSPLPFTGKPIWGGYFLPRGLCPHEHLLQQKSGALRCPDFPLPDLRKRRHGNDRTSCWIAAKLRNFK